MCRRYDGVRTSENTSAVCLMTLFQVEMLWTITLPVSCLRFGSGETYFIERYPNAAPAHVFEFISCEKGNYVSVSELN